MNNKTALIFGASKGVGREIALYFAEKGYNIAVAARSVDLLESLASKIKENSVEALVLEADLVNNKDKSMKSFSETDNVVKEVIEKTITNFGQLDLLVYSAGEFNLTPLQLGKESDYVSKTAMANKIFYEAAISSIIHSAAHLNKTKGTAVMISSHSGLERVSFDSQAPYAASKSALNGFVKGISADIQRNNYAFRVYALAPGTIDGDTIRKVMSSPENQESAIKKNGSLEAFWSNMLKPEDIYKKIEHLTSHPTENEPQNDHPDKTYSQKGPVIYMPSASF